MVTAAAEPAATKRRTRRYRKRTKFQHVPRMAYPVRALWDAASQEEREQAHRACTTFLELWLAKITKEEAMERLQLSPLRLWQLSQQALAGMVAGLLRQPKRRVPKGEVTMPNAERDVRALRKRNAELEKEVEDLKVIQALLRELPGNRDRSAGREVRRRREEAATVAPAAATSSPDPSEPTPAATKTAPTAPRRRSRADRGGAQEASSPAT